MEGKRVIAALERQLGARGDEALADALGCTTQAVARWRDSPSLTTRQVVSMVVGRGKAATAQVAQHSLYAIVEFFPVTPVRRGARGTVDLFDATQDDYRRGLRKVLDQTSGVYVFYDSRGRALYVGKAQRQSLWRELRSALNRSRGGQTLTRVVHDTSAPFELDRDSKRALVSRQVPLAELAAYFTAWEVDPVVMIPQVEALLIRSFANDTLNVRMERLGHQR